MSSTTLQSRSYAPTRPNAVSDALRELATAAGQFGVALWRAIRPRSVVSAPLSPAEEANQVREMASSYRTSDPAFALDLYAAADRHERAHGLWTTVTPIPKHI